MKYRFFAKGLNGCVVETTTQEGERYYNEYECSVAQAREKVANEQKVIERAEAAANAARQSVVNNYLEATQGAA